MRREPALIVTFVAWIILQAVNMLDLESPVDTALIESAAQLVVLIGGGLIVRARVFSEQTIRAAGYTPDQIEARAASPMIPTAEG